MKTAICVLAATLAMGFWRFDPSYLPSPRADNREVARTGPETKVAIVNFHFVVQNYPRAKRLRREDEELSLTFKYKANELQREIAWLENALTIQGLPAMVRNGCHCLISQSRMDLEMLNSDCPRIIEERRRISDEVVWKEIKMSIDVVAKVYGFQLVLGVGKMPPMQRSVFRLVPHAECRTQDSVSPVYVHKGIDITETVVQVLQQSCGK